MFSKTLSTFSTYDVSKSEGEINVYLPCLNRLILTSHTEATSQNFFYSIKSTSADTFPAILDIVAEWFYVRLILERSQVQIPLTKSKNLCVFVS